jgi:hypothetical protein
MNQRQTGMPVVRKSGGGMGTIQSTRSASIIALRMSPSPPLLDDNEPLAMTKPAMPPP